MGVIGKVRQWLKREDPRLLAVLGAGVPVAAYGLWKFTRATPKAASAVVVTPAPAAGAVAAPAAPAAVIRPPPPRPPLPPAPPSTTMLVMPATEKFAVLRIDPGLSSRRITFVPAGTRVEAFEVVQYGHPPTPWVRIQLQDQTEGWMSGLVLQPSAGAWT